MTRHNPRRRAVKAPCSAEQTATHSDSHTDILKALERLESALDLVLLKLADRSQADEPIFTRRGWK